MNITQMPVVPLPRLLVLLTALLVGLTVVSRSRGQDLNNGPESNDLQTPELGPRPSLGDLAGRRVTRVEVVLSGDRWLQPHPPLRRMRVGEALSLELARRAIRELTDSGRYASVRAEAEPHADGAVLRLVAMPRRLVASTRLVGGVLDADETLRAADVHEQTELTAPELERIAQRVRDHYARNGFPAAQVTVDTTDTEQPLHVLLLIGITPGEPQLVRRLTFIVTPDPTLHELARILRTYAVQIGDRADQNRFVSADRELEAALRASGWHRAAISHRVNDLRQRGAWLQVRVRAGPLLKVTFEGQRRFDVVQLEAALQLESSDDRSTGTLVERLTEFYHRRGFLDAQVRVEERGGAQAAVHELAFLIREREPVRVAAREFTCLTGSRTPKQVGQEIDSFLAEELPGTDLFGPVDPNVVDSSLGPRGPTGSRVSPFRLTPYKTYVPEVYERALKHVQDLYRSEGYLSATVGPVQLLRRRCSARSSPGRCIPLGPQRRPPTVCRYDEVGLPLDEPSPDPTLTCVSDPAHGVLCEPDVVLHIPIKLGPRTYLYDVSFEGNRALVEQELQETAELTVGDPVSQVELERARRRLLDAYAEQGYAFAAVETQLDLSPDRTRGRVHFIISESEQVRVSRIVVRGARMTNERLILSRVALSVGEPYRRSDVRKTEERLATLGVFSNVSVGLEDPYVPAREKVVLITVVERVPQYVDEKVGFSTGEGFRVTFEYGHRNLFFEAIRFTLRVQLGYLPDFLILERDVRQKFGELEVGDRIERRNTASMQFPDIGLGPLFRLGVDGVDIRDNSRDFGLTRDAGIVTLIFQPTLQLSAQLGGSVELNTAGIFGEAQKGALEQYVRDHPRRANTFRVPEGTTVAFAQRVGTTWDRRDNPLGATRGTLVSVTVEHVRAVPVGETARQDPGETVFAATTSDFFRISNKLGAYLRLTDAGLALAASFRWGFNHQLIVGSRTYPDRLFFLGGVDSIRGFLQDSVIPEDIAEQLLDPAAELTVNQVVIRGGDIFVNPRLELRVPVSSTVQTALFLDSGNLWTDPTLADPLRLRYAAGSGLRIRTPVGPLVFDYGFNLERVADKLDWTRQRRRFWEDLGAFHFSIGLF